MSADHLDVVQRLHNERPPARTLQGALDFLIRLLHALPPDERAGLLSKPAGENIVSYRGQMVSAGRICYPDGQLYKVLTDVPTTNGPGWADDGLVEVSRYIPLGLGPGPVDPPDDDDDPDVPPQPPVDVKPLLDRLAAVEADQQTTVARLTATEASLIKTQTACVGLRQRVVELEARKVPTGVKAGVSLFGRVVPIQAELTY